MNDDGESQGMSGTAGYLLGRMSAENARSRSDWVDNLVARRRRPEARFFREADVHAKIAEWQAALASRDAIIDQLQEHAAGLASERDQWRDYAKAIEGEREELKEQFRSLTVNANLMVERLDEYDRANEALEAEVEALRAEVARLKGSGG